VNARPYPAERDPLCFREGLAPTSIGSGYLALVGYLALAFSR